jgi:hypothetical protein
MLRLLYFFLMTAYQEASAGHRWLRWHQPFSALFALIFPSQAMANRITYDARPDLPDISMSNG